MLLWHLGILSLGFFVPIRRFGGVWAAGVGVGCGIAGSGGGRRVGDWGCRGRSWEGRQAQASPRGLRGEERGGYYFLGAAAGGGGLPGGAAAEGVSMSPRGGQAFRAAPF